MKPVMFPHTVRKKFGPYPVCHRQPKADSHCKFLHGYGRYAVVEVGAEDLDDCNWVLDFGGKVVKNFREWLDDRWEHKVLIGNQDPQLKMWQQCAEKGMIDLVIVAERFVGMEGQAQWLFAAFQELIHESIERGRQGGKFELDDRDIMVESVEVFETQFNSAKFRRIQTL